MPELIEQANDLVESLSPYTIIGIFVAFALVIIGLRQVLKKPVSRLTAFSSSTGSVLVSRKALQDLIRQACLKDDWVEAARPVVKIFGEQINTNVSLRLSKADHLRETSERLQNRISELLQKSLSFEQIGPIEIMVTSFGKSDVDELPATETESVIEAAPIVGESILEPKPQALPSPSSDSPAKLPKRD